MNGVADCYELGLIQAIGVSNYGPKQLRKVHAALERRGVPLASAQVGAGRGACVRSVGGAGRCLLVGRQCHAGKQCRRAAPAPC